MVKLSQSIGLVLMPMAVLIVLGLPAFIAVWIGIVGLFLISRLSEKFGVFTNWSWLHFSLTIGCGLAIPYVLLLLSAGF